MSAKILRLPTVKDLTGLSRSSIYEYMANGEFPRQVKLGKRAVGWKESAVQSWIDKRSEAAQ